MRNTPPCTQYRVRQNKAKTVITRRRSLRTNAVQKEKPPGGGLLNVVEPSEWLRSRLPHWLSPDFFGSDAGQFDSSKILVDEIPIPV